MIQRQNWMNFAGKRVKLNKCQSTQHLKFLFFAHASRTKTHHDREIEAIRNEVSSLRMQIHQFEEQRDMLISSVTQILKVLSQKFEMPSNRRG